MTLRKADSMQEERSGTEGVVPCPFEVWAGHAECNLCGELFSNHAPPAPEPVDEPSEDERVSVRLDLIRARLRQITRGAKTPPGVERTLLRLDVPWLIQRVERGYSEGKRDGAREERERAEARARVVTERIRSGALDSETRSGGEGGKP